MSIQITTRLFCSGVIRYRVRSDYFARTPRPTAGRFSIDLWWQAIDNGCPRAPTSFTRLPLATSWCTSIPAPSCIPFLAYPFCSVPWFTIRPDEFLPVIKHIPPVYRTDSVRACVKKEREVWSCNFVNYIRWAGWTWLPIYRCSRLRDRQYTYVCVLRVCTRNVFVVCLSKDSGMSVAVTITRKRKRKRKRKGGGRRRRGKKRHTIALKYIQ